MKRSDVCKQIATLHIAQLKIIANISENMWNFVTVISEFERA